jgi:RsiW-degrading membrane proteinase PrsW (M82 family)
VLHLSVVSTLFPHLPHRRMLLFQIAVGITTLLLIVLGLLRWTGPSIAVVSFAIPLIYLLYLYEVEVYEEEPVQVIGLTVLLGIALGIPWAWWTGPIITHTLLQNSTLGAVSGPVLLGGIVLPVAAQLLMLVGALVLYRVGRFNEALDGFTFGAACALGFTLSSTLVNLLPNLKTGLVSNAPIEENILDLLQRGLFLPLINASITGLIAGALWLHRGLIRRLRFHRSFVALSTILAIAVVVRIILGVVSVFAIDPLYTALTYACITAALLIWVRIALHQMLLTEAVEVTIGPDAVCSHCHFVVPRMAFCPHCGIATCATPKTGSGRTHRRFR